MRTPLTGLQLTLEAGREQADEGRLRGVLEAALATTRRLHGTIEEVLWLSSSAAPDRGSCTRPRNARTGPSPATADAGSAHSMLHRTTSTSPAPPRRDPRRSVGQCVRPRARQYSPGRALSRRRARLRRQRRGHHA
ncbi:histidine kinase dimerization/phospho-acceptor domain-containing protein [Streptomyces sp. NPDC057636]|uniref:histidine kinase dimerization/phospho-acceptor domain-containing protein n=1 Tax=Streptomyces sp. NPDC057636 TaxID=3346189 RepID=UPI003676ED59